VRIFVLNANSWVDENSWPPARVRDAHLFLASGGRANSSSGDGRLASRPPESGLPDVFVHDPRAPLQSAGGHSCCFETVAPIGPRDQRRSETWNDILVYESAPVSQLLVIAGEVRAELYVRFSGVSADFVARLVDVHPCGDAYNLVDTVIRIDRDRRTRHARAEIEPAGSGAFRLSLALGATYVRLSEGHKLRLEIGGSSYPAYARNWNGRSPSIAPTDFAGAMSLQEVLHDREHPSALVLPVLEGHLP
jgi:putative CocE/NonD family hydrolase